MHIIKVKDKFVKRVILKVELVEIREYEYTVP